MRKWSREFVIEFFKRKSDIEKYFHTFFHDLNTQFQVDIAAKDVPYRYKPSRPPILSLYDNMEYISEIMNDLDYEFRVLIAKPDSKKPAYQLEFDVTEKIKKIASMDEKQGDEEVRRSLISNSEYAAVPPHLFYAVKRMSENDERVERLAYTTEGANEILGISMNDSDNKSKTEQNEQVVSNASENKKVEDTKQQAEKRQQVVDSDGEDSDNESEDEAGAESDNESGNESEPPVKDESEDEAGAESGVGDNDGDSDDEGGDDNDEKDESQDMDVEDSGHESEDDSDHKKTKKKSKNTQRSKKAASKKRRRDSDSEDDGERKKKKKRTK